MSRTYQPPVLVHYGSVAALTGSFIKCSPGLDTLFGVGTHTHAVAANPADPANPILLDPPFTGQTAQEHEAATGEDCFGTTGQPI